MRTLLRKYNTCIILTLALGGMSLSVSAGEPKVKVSKSWSKSINVGPHEKISLTNQFGDMKIIPWNKSEVKIDVTISAEAATEAKAREIIDRITIEDGKKIDSGRPSQS